MTTVRPTDDQIQTSMVKFLKYVLPGVEVVTGQQNLTPEPADDNFIVITPIMRRRLRTNIDGYVDCAFTGQIDGTVLTVTDMQLGTIVSGAILLGSNIVQGTYISAFESGKGAIGTYKVSAPQTVAAEQMASGVLVVQQGIELRYQLDFHGPASPDNAVIVSTMFRDQWAVSFFNQITGDGIGQFVIGQSPIGGSGSGIAPLHADDPLQRPYENEDMQIEKRWTVDAYLQANQNVIVPQQFFDEAVIGLISVDAVFPPKSNAIGFFSIGVSPIGVA